MKRRQKGSQNGVALFIVISAMALLSVLLAELTYSTQIGSRMAYNYVDNLKAYYMAKAAFKLSLMRLKIYQQVRTFLNDPKNKGASDVMGKDLAEKIWSIPFIYPIPVPKEATMTETDTIKAFMKESSLSGSFTAGITGQSTRLNINNLLIKRLQTDPRTRQRPQAPAPNPTPSPQSEGQGPAEGSEINFRAVLEPAITSVIEQKKDSDREFAETYRNVMGKDIVDAIEAYLFRDAPPSNLPGFKPLTPKEAPFYSLSELHLIPGIDDGLYEVLEPLLTVYSTAGINVNTLDKTGLLALIPEMTVEEAEDVLRKRDDPEVGQKFSNEEAFWTAIGTTSAARNLDEIKARLSSANLKVIIDEQSFKIGVQATVGLSSRRLEAYVTLDTTGKKTPGQPVAPQAPGTPAPNPTPGAPGQNEASSKKASGVNLIYWRML